VDERLQIALKELRLSGLAQSLEVRLQEAGEERILSKYLKPAKYLKADLMFLDCLEMKQFPANREFGEFWGHPSNYRVISKGFKSTTIICGEPLLRSLPHLRGPHPS